MSFHIALSSVLWNAEERSFSRKFEHSRVEFLYRCWCTGYFVSCLFVWIGQRSIYVTLLGYVFERGQDFKRQTTCLVGLMTPVVT
ncbi:hypothetical protein BDN70DRAFT_398525 [Pholiota conissans]|uniref:Uncharacterized protein n=1 Tax=Pholiota conissans TaxID=109636 RepID=A0A9P6CTR9_9AGAR|nr:hypothetical protein BDN70DRAFT_398525 [Pholiota conissans]